VSEVNDESADLESTTSSEDDETSPAAEPIEVAGDRVAGEVAADPVAVDTAGDWAAAETVGDLSTMDADVEPPVEDVEPAADTPVEGVASADAAAEPIEPDAGDPLEEFRAALRSKPGDWYVVHTYSGMEKRVKANLENRISSLNMEDFIYEVHVPQEDVWEVKNGQRKQVSRTVLPGYVLVRMDLTDESWSAVRHTPSVTGFVGHSHQPVPLSLGEVEAMLAPAVTEEKAAPEQKAQKKVEFTDFAVDDSVLIVDGAFATLHATITELNVDAQRVKALVEIFGRETPVELSFSQIQKV
jgi:transcriptional antiterminator NusG